MRNLVVIAGLCLVAIAIGAWLYFGQHPSAPQNQTASTTNASTETPQEKNVAFKVIGHGSQAAEISARKNYAIYDANEFGNFWKKAHGSDGVALPTIDFTKNYVIAVFAGTLPTGGYTISVDHITDVGTARSVAVLIEEPGANCSVIEEQTSPYQFVSVPLGDVKALAHTDVQVKKDCK